MKANRIKKTRPPTAKKTETSVTQQEVQPPVVNTPPSHADTLLCEAEQEPDLNRLEKYIRVINELRKKGFSFREIAEWLSERDVETDHNAVYRVYTKNLTRYEAMAEEEREEAERLKEMYLEQ